MFDRVPNTPTTKVKTAMKLLIENGYEPFKDSQALLHTRKIVITKFLVGEEYMYYFYFPVPNGKGGLNSIFGNHPFLFTRFHFYKILP